MVASVLLDSGSTLEFYDFGGAALISETGKAGTPVAFQSQGAIPANELSDVWRRFAANVPVPKALTDLQERLMVLKAPPADSLEAMEPNAGGAPFSEAVSSPEGTLAVPDGCGNGCCDWDWLSTNFLSCQNHDDYKWFLFKHGWSFANSNNVKFFNGMVCSAVGTSLYKVAVVGGGGAWNIPERNYRVTTWTASWYGYYATKTVSSTVNTESDPHMHTYCGGFTY
jgi:hypothetical protein